MSDYDYTPSFYNNKEFFNNYLGQTSYYLNLQNIVDKIILATNANSILELGSALGTTSIKLANKYKFKDFVGVDIRQDVVQQANCEAPDNCAFIKHDMCKYVKRSLSQFDLIYMLYSFHHIVDPLEEKEAFLKDCYDNMKEGSYLFIGETFITKYGDNYGIQRLFENRAEEGYASMFWSNFNSIEVDALNATKQIAVKTSKDELDAGTLVNKRDNEYLVTFNWLKDTCKIIGFDIVLAEPVNSIMDKVILLRR